MARTQLSEPTVFGTAIGLRSGAVTMLLQRGDAVKVTEPPDGRFYVRLQSSDGRRVNTTVAAQGISGEVNFDTLLRLFDEHAATPSERADLSASELRDDRLMMAYWPDAEAPQRPLSYGSPFAPELDSSGDASKPLVWVPAAQAGRQAFLQCALVGGASVIGVCPPFATKVLMVRSGSRPGTVAIVPTFEGDGRLADAYGWFLATGSGEAADAVGARLAEQVLSRGGRPDYSNILTATHWCLRVSESATLTKLSGLLQTHYNGRADADVLELLAAFQRLGSATPAFAKQFYVTLSGLEGTPPHRSATMALLVDWLLPMRERIRRAELWTAEHDRLFGWVRRLTDALIWDVPTVAYRGLTPLSPDPEAVLADTPDAKKKSEVD